MNNHKITNLATPTASTDAVTKAYVDSQTFGDYSLCYNICDSSSNNIQCASGYDTIVRWDGSDCGYSTGEYTSYYYVHPYAPAGIRLYHVCSYNSGYYGGRIIKDDVGTICEIGIWPADTTYTIGVCCTR